LINQNKKGGKMNFIKYLAEDGGEIIKMYIASIKGLLGRIYIVFDGMADKIHELLKIH